MFGFLTLFPKDNSSYLVSNFRPIVSRTSAAVDRVLSSGPSFLFARSVWRHFSGEIACSSNNEPDSSYGRERTETFQKCFYFGLGKRGSISTIYLEDVMRHFGSSLYKQTEEDMHDVTGCRKYDVHVPLNCKISIAKIGLLCSFRIGVKSFHLSN